MSRTNHARTGRLKHSPIAGVEAEWLAQKYLNIIGRTDGMSKSAIRDLGIFPPSRFEPFWTRTLAPKLETRVITVYVRGRQFHYTKYEVRRSPLVVVK